MASSASFAEVNNMICAVCTEVFVSPRFLPCHHTFCLPCLEQLVNTHGDVIPCPSCNIRATVPSGGAHNLQVNFYLTNEALERARKETMAAEIKHLGSQAEAIQSKHESLQRHKVVLLEKRAEAVKEIQDRHDKIAAMVSQCRDDALSELSQLSDNLEQDLAADIQRAEDALNSLLQLQERARSALSTSHEVVQVKKDIRRAREKDKSLSDLFTTFSHYPAFRPNINENQESLEKTILDSVRRYIGTPTSGTNCAIM